jgi:hypothetical protein
MNGLIRVLIWLLLRCYPRAWRQRYGAEFVALLAQLPPTPSRIADILRGALDAHRERGRRWLLQTLDTQALGSDERRFWRRWVVALGIAGMASGLIYRLTDAIIIQTAPAQGVGNFMWDRLFALPCFITLTLILGIAQRRTLRALVPTISQWWGAMALFGPTITLAIMTTDHSYSLLPDLFSMTSFLFSQMSQASLPTREIVLTFDRLVLSTILPILFYVGMVATFQAYLLKGVVARAGWWIAVAMLAALAGLATLRLTAPLHVNAYQPWSTIARPELLILDIIVTVTQFGLACAAYGIVSGAGLLLLHRLRARPQTAAAAAIS